MLRVRSGEKWEGIRQWTNVRSEKLRKERAILNDINSNRTATEQQKAWNSRGGHIFRAPPLRPLLTKV